MQRQHLGLASMSGSRIDMLVCNSVQPRSDGSPNFSDHGMGFCIFLEQTLALNHLHHDSIPRRKGDVSRSWTRDSNRISMASLRGYALIDKTKQYQFINSATTYFSTTTSTFEVF